MENWKSTKFFISVLGLAMVYVAFMMGKLDQQTFMTVLLATTGIYSAANVAQKFRPIE